jgi:hypothetical protein
MKHEAEFKTFLTTQKVSVKTGKPYSVKVAGDVASRCRLVERLFGVEFSELTLNHSEVERLCERIKTEQTSSTDRVPYAHNALILALRTYRKFVDQHFSLA